MRAPRPNFKGSRKRTRAGGLAHTIATWQRDGASKAGGRALSAARMEKNAHTQSAEVVESKFAKFANFFESFSAPAVTLEPHNCHVRR